MFRIRKILDSTSSANRDAIDQVVKIFSGQFPLARQEDLKKIPEQLDHPLKYQYRSVLFVAESGTGKIKGFAMLLHMEDVGIGYLEFISAAKGGTGGGVGGALYERVREECVSLKAKGLFFECAVDDAAKINDPVKLKENIARLKFYERYGAYPVENDLYSAPAEPGDQELYYLMMDGLGLGETIRKAQAKKIVRAILVRKYGALISAEQIDEVVGSFSGDTLKLRAPRHIKKPASSQVPARKSRPITLVVNEGHSIHHVKDRGYVEAPVRLSTILTALDKTGLFSRVEPKRVSESVIKKVHLPAYVDYLRTSCSKLPAGKSMYPQIFPLRNLMRPPRDVEMQVGYYCLDTFTPLNSNAYLAARGAVDCAMTAANAVLDGEMIGYALVRPPGHHAERRAFGGFCYFNSAAVVANHLSDYGKVAVLDIDFHHGNGTQDIFYERSDVLTVSIHGDPKFAYPYFAGFRDETGKNQGEGFNINYPLAENIDPAKYLDTLAAALRRIKAFAPAYLVLSLGLDTAKSDPTGTWRHGVEDFFRIGEVIGAQGHPTVVIQEGGYRTQTLGANAGHFFQGLWKGFYGDADGAVTGRQRSRKK